MMCPALLLVASSLAVPLRDCDTAPCYPTAYVDQGNRDWACRGLTYSDHAGTDFGIGGLPEMDRGRAVYAAAAGQVIQVEDGHFDRCLSGNCEGGDGYGNHILLDHGDGSHSLYAHLRNGSVVVQVGDEVACGEAIGLVGSSGFSTGAHLHFEWRVDGDVEDPFTGPCREGESAWVEQGLHGSLPARLCAHQGADAGEDKSRVLNEPSPGDVIAPQGRGLSYCWHVENSGSRSWEPGVVSGILVSGERLGHEGNLNLQEVIEPGETVTLCADLHLDAPVNERVRASWRLARAGSVFGAILILRVDVTAPQDGGSLIVDAGVSPEGEDGGARQARDAGSARETSSGCACSGGSHWEFWLLLALFLGRRPYRAGTLN